MSLSDNSLEEKLDGVTKKDMQFYLRLWNYRGVVFCGSSKILLALEKIWNEKCVFRKDDKQILKVTDQDENEIWDSETGTYGAVQLLYELEVCAAVPREIREQITMDGWIRFLARFTELYTSDGWQILFTKKMPLTELIAEKTKGSFTWMQKHLILNDTFEKYLILDNGNGGSARACYEQYKAGKRIEAVRLIVLFRAYMIERICDYFQQRLEKEQVRLATVNWHWALMHPVYPKTDAVSLEIENRNRWTVSEIAGRESEYEDFLKEIYGSKYDPAYVREIMDIPNRLKIEAGNVIHEDRSGKYLNVSMGERKTVLQPLSYDNTVYLFGGCVFFGYAVEDSHTVASCLQKKLNCSRMKKRWRVVNYGTWGGDIDWTYQRFYQIPYKPGDLVLVSYAGLMPLGKDWRKRDISVFLKQVHTNSNFYFNSIVHCNQSGYEKIADGIMQLFGAYLQEDLVPGRSFYLNGMHQKRKYYEEQVTEYVRCVQKNLPALHDKKVGAIVMNCNPFTLGHQYLAETAANQVDVLLLFVVEEDRSFFAFQDRIAMVREGTAHLKNVFVLPSGKMMISTVTFPGYFQKEMPHAEDLDVSLDVSVFGAYIAEAFHITVRFVGEEPFDIVTRNYNESMKRLLPAYGVQVAEIPRKTSGGAPISATRVRKLLKEKKLEALKELVPESTYACLKVRYTDIGRV